MKDELHDVLIDPLFYGFIDEEGLDTARYAYGAYKSELTDIAWHCFLYCKKHKGEL